MARKEDPLRLRIGQESYLVHHADLVDLEYLVPFYESCMFFIQSS